MADREYHLRRPRVRRRADRPSAGSGDHRASRRRGARRSGVRRDAGAARSRRPAAHAASLPRCRRSRPTPPTAAWSIAGATRSAPRRPMASGICRWCRASASCLGPRLAEPARSAPSGRRGAGQATAADAQPGDGGDRQGRRDAVRHAGRRRADAGHAAGLLNIFQFGMEVQEAIEAPRVASYSFPSSFAPFEYFPGRLAVECADRPGGAVRSLRHGVMR